MDLITKTILLAEDEKENSQLALTEFNDTWSEKYPNITTSWQTHWTELSTFGSICIQSNVSSHTGTTKQMEYVEY